jgi:hypothetical protein
MEVYLIMGSYHNVPGAGARYLCIIWGGGGQFDEILMAFTYASTALFQLYTVISRWLEKPFGYGVYRFASSSSSLWFEPINTLSPFCSKMVCL